MIYSRQTKGFCMANPETKGGETKIAIDLTIEISFGDISGELLSPEKLKTLKEKRPMDPRALCALAGYSAASLRDSFPLLVVFPTGDEPRADGLMDVDDAGMVMYEQDFTVGEVSEVILALDSLSSLKANKQMEIQFKRVIVEAVNDAFPEEGKIDIDGYFGGRS